MIDLILITAGLVGLMIGTATDLKKREVPDWLNYSLIAIGLGLRLINSLITKDWYYLLYGILGFGAFLALAYIMFYAGQWGGGDSKLLMGIGAIFATYPVFLLNYFNPLLKFPFLAIFLINLLLIGAVYGLFYSIFLAIKFRKKFLIEIKKIVLNKTFIKARRILLIASLILLILSFVLLKDFLLMFLMLILILIFILTFYVWVFSKAVEKACMFKYVEPEELTEGDWIAKNVKVDGKLITGPKDLGISKENIKKLINFKKQKKINKILIKEGIPFVPSFLIALIISLIYGNFIFLFV